jgi:hypothetical protein
VYPDFPRGPKAFQHSFPKFSGPYTKFMMKSFIVLSALAIVGIQAQGPGGTKGGGSAGGTKGAGAKGGAKGGNAGIMSSLGAKYGEKGVPFGPAPTGCSAYEVLFGWFFTTTFPTLDSGVGG